MRVCVLGLGEIGLPTAKYIAKRGFSVQGYDISAAAVERAKKNGIPAVVKWEEVTPADVYVICVSTLLKKDEPDLGPVFDVCEKIAGKSKRDTLISIESTIIPGTCKKVYNFFEGRGLLVHVPHRYWAKEPLKHGVKQLRVIGGINARSLKAGIRFYRDRLKIPLFPVSRIEVAEMAKVAENAYRYVQIAFAEEMRMVCEELGLKFEEVREACNTKWNIEILEARDGIGGHCLPKEIRYFSSLTSHKILSKSAMAVDAAYRRYIRGKKEI
ncbi:MAG: NAD(P)-binding domain-containing protein [Candidatus Hadarchaeales archaeon]